MFFYLPPPSSFCQPNPMRDPMRAINSMTLGYVGAPGPSLLLPPSSFLYPNQTPYARPYARPMRAPYARDTFIKGNRSWTLLRNHHKKRYPMRGPMRALCAPPMRGPRSSMDLDPAPCFEINPKKRNLCASPYARNTIFNGFRSGTLL